MQNCRKFFFPVTGGGGQIFSPTKGRIDTIVPSSDDYENST